ncbi:MAG: DUF89 family protein, partial [bacterium]|nr:DUF89 family protein [bacterium]
LYIGIHREAAVIETGSFCAGTVLENVSEAFKEIYYSSDIIISKGQGNFETLEQEPEDIVFIFKVKCDVVARHADLELGSLVFAGREQFGS